MLLLRASSDAINGQADIEAANGGDVDSGVKLGDQLVSFSETAHAGQSVAAFQAALGPAAFVEAAATVAIFNGLVRTADASGIPLDAGTQMATAGDRDTLGINAYSGAGNSPSDAALGLDGNAAIDLHTAFD